MNLYWWLSDKGLYYWMDLRFEIEMEIEGWLLQDITGKSELDTYRYPDGNRTSQDESWNINSISCEFAINNVDDVK